VVLALSHGWLYNRTQSVLLCILFTRAALPLKIIYCFPLIRRERGMTCGLAQLANSCGGLVACQIASANSVLPSGWVPLALMR
jgi:hypothetical protein